MIVLRHQTSIAAAYNSILDMASRSPSVEGVILLHDDVELLDREWRAKLDDAFEQGGDVVGVIGGRGRGGMAWWTREQQFGRVAQPDLIMDKGLGLAEVDVLDGLILGVSPWGVRNLRFEVDAYPGFHGYDADICSQARARGRRVFVAPIEVMHHTRGAFGTRKSYEDWIRAVLAWEIRWKATSWGGRTIRRLRVVSVPLEVRVRPSARRRRAGLRR